MQEIISMTTQEQPLAVGLPLYPFSIDTAFQLAEKRAVAEANAVAGIIRGTGSSTKGMSGIETLLNASSGAMAEEEVDVRDALAPIPDVSIIGDDNGDATMSDHVVHAPLPSSGVITVPSVQSIGGGWMME